jgi:hypothetical protein
MGRVSQKTDLQEHDSSTAMAAFSSLFQYHLSATPKGEGAEGE